MPDFGFGGRKYDPKKDEKKIDAAALARQQEREAAERRRKGTLTIGDLARPPVRENPAPSVFKKGQYGPKPKGNVFAEPTGLKDFIDSQTVPGLGTTPADVLSSLKIEVEPQTFIQRSQREPGTLAHAMYLYDMLEFGQPTYGVKTGFRDWDMQRRQFMSRVMDAGVVGDIAAHDGNFEVPVKDLVTNLYKLADKKFGQKKAFEFLAAAGLVPDGRILDDKTNHGIPDTHQVRGIDPRTGKQVWYLPKENEASLNRAPGDYLGGAPSVTDFNSKDTLWSVAARQQDRQFTEKEMRDAGISKRDRGIIKDNPGIAGDSGLDTYMRQVQGVVNPFTLGVQLSGRSVQDLDLAGRLAVTAGDFLFQIAVPIGSSAAARRLGAKALAVEGAVSQLMLDVFTVDNLLDAPDLYQEARDKGAFIGTVSFAQQMADQFNPLRLIDPNKSPEEKLITALSLLTYGGGSLMARAQNKHAVAVAAAENAKLSSFAPDLQRQAKETAKVYEKAFEPGPMGKAMAESAARRMAAMAQAVAKQTGENASDILKEATPTAVQIDESRAAVKAAVKDSAETRIAEAEAQARDAQGLQDAGLPDDAHVVDLAKRHAAITGTPLNLGVTFDDSFELQQDPRKPDFGTDNPSDVYQWFDIDHSQTREYTNDDGVIGMEGDWEIWHGTDKTTGEPAAFLYLKSGTFEDRAVKKPVVIKGNLENMGDAGDYDLYAGLYEGEISDRLTAMENERAIKVMLEDQRSSTMGPQHQEPGVQEYEEAPVKKALRQHFGRVAASLDVPMDNAVLSSIAETNLSGYMRMTASEKARQSHKDEIRRAIEIEYEMPRDYLKGKSAKQVMGEIDRTEPSDALKEARAKADGKPAKKEPAQRQTEGEGKLPPWIRDGQSESEWREANDTDPDSVVGTEFTFEPMRGDPYQAKVTGYKRVKDMNLYEVTSGKGMTDGYLLGDLVRRGMPWPPENARSAEGKATKSKVADSDKVAAMRARLEELRARPNAIKPKSKQSGGTSLTKEDFEQLVLEVAVWAIDTGNGIKAAIKEIASRFDLTAADVRDIEDAVREDYGDTVEPQSYKDNPDSRFYQGEKGLDKRLPASPERAEVLGSAILSQHQNGAQRAAHISEIIGENTDKFTSDADALDGLTHAQYEELVGLYVASVRSLGPFSAMVESVARNNGGRAEIGPVKRPGRLISKWMAEYDGDLSRVKDVVRGTVIVEGVTDVQRVGAHIKEHAEIHVEDGNPRFKDLYSEPASPWYAHILTNLIVEGMVTELQINTDVMLSAKHEAHSIYVEAETLKRRERELVAEGKMAEAQEVREKASEAMSRMADIYGDAFDRATAGTEFSRNTSSETGTQGGLDSRYSESEGNARKTPSLTTNTPASNTSANTSKPLDTNVVPLGKTTSSTRKPSNIIDASISNDGTKQTDVSGVGLGFRFEHLAGDASLLDSDLYFPPVTRTGKYSKEDLAQIGQDLERAVLEGKTIVVDARIADQDAWKLVGVVPLRYAANRVIVVDGGRIGKRILDSFNAGKEHPVPAWNLWRFSWSDSSGMAQDVIVRLAKGQKMPTAEEIAVQSSERKTDGGKHNTQTVEGTGGSQAGVREGARSRGEGVDGVHDPGVRTGREEGLRAPAQSGNEPAGGTGSNAGVPVGDGGRLGEGHDARGRGEGEGDQRGGTVRAEDAGREPGDRPARTGRPGEAPGDFRLTKKTVGSVVHQGKAAKRNALLAALEARKSARERGWATETEQAAMAAFPGWGFDKSIFKASSDTFKSKVGVAIRSLMSKQEVVRAVAAGANSHFTSPEVVGAMWDAITRMGFTGGKVLEPSAGSGLFYTLAPDVGREADWTLVDKDDTSGEILSFLFPESSTMTKGFESSGIKENSQDLVVSNVPFADIGVFDLAMESSLGDAAKPLTSSVHNYFIARSVIDLKPGGIAALVTSRYTLDGVSDDHVALREWVDRHAEFLGAVRLPSSAFGTSADTEVVTDVLFLRKRGHGLPEKARRWTGTKPVTIRQQSKKDPWSFVEHQFNVNEWYVKHPEMVLGKQSATGTMYGPEDYNVVGELTPESLKDALKKLPKNVFSPVNDAAPTILGETMEHSPVPSGVRVGQVWSEGGKFFTNDPVLGKQELTDIWGTGKQVQANKKKFKDYLDIRSALDTVMAAQASGTDEELSIAQSALRKAHDKFLSAHGALTAFKTVRRKSIDPDTGKQVVDDETGELVYDEYPSYLNEKLLWNDSQAPRVFAIEMTDRDTGEFEGLTDVAHSRILGKSGIKESASSAGEALSMSLNQMGRVDMDYMSAVSGIGIDELKDALRGEMFLDPTGGYVDKETYLSGNVVEKLKIARESALSDDAFAVNVSELEKVQPPRMSIDDIVFRLGSTFVPEQTMKRFAEEVFVAQGVSVKRSPGKVDVRGHTTHSVSLEFGTTKRDAMEVFDAAVNNSSIKVYGKDENGNSVIDQVETEAAEAKVQEMRERFDGWVLSSHESIKEIEDAYNENVNVYQVPAYDGSGLTFPGLSNGVELRTHRVNAIQRVLRQPFTLLWHGVGSGKTFTAAMAMAKLKQTGLRRKPAFLTYKPTHVQITREILQAYPEANILSASEDSFNTQNREKFLAKVAYGDWDAVIMTHEQFARLTLSKQGVSDFYESELDRLMTDHGFSSLADVENASIAYGDQDTRNIARRILRLEEQRERALSKIKDTGLTLEQTGIDHVVVDEAHFFKGLPISTAQDIGQASSVRAVDMLMKSEYLRKSEGGMTFMTGTAIVNSFAEVHNWLRYLTPDALASESMRMFDDWSGTYAYVEGAFEVHVSGKMVWKDRVRKFQNVASLARMVSQTWDIVTTRDVKEIVLPRMRDEDGNITDKPIVVTVQPTKLQKEIFQEVSSRYAAIDPRDPEGDNPLSLSTLGRLASQDPQLAAHLSRTPVPRDGTGAGNKAAAVADNVAANYREFADDNAAQLVFVDYGVPDPTGRKFNFYEFMTGLLVDRGVKREHIARISDVKNNREKDNLSRHLRSGKIRVLIGSRPKLGVGMNVQERLVAAHHLDVGWNPAMVEQGNGRIVRAGNIFTGKGGVKVYYYVTSGTYDEVTAQRTSGKANVIEQIMHAMSGVATGLKEVDAIADSEGAASFAEIAMSASGDRRIMEMFTLHRELSKLQASSDALARRVTSAKSRANGLENQEIPRLERGLKQAKSVREATDWAAHFLDADNNVQKTPTKYLSEELGKRVKAYRSGPQAYVRPELVATLYGNWQLFSSYAWHEGDFSPKLVMKGPEGTTREWGGDLVGGGDISGVSLKYAVEKAIKEETDVDQWERALTSATSELANYRNSSTAEDKFAPQIPQIAAKVDRLSFETGMSVAMLRGAKEGMGGFGTEPLQHHDAEGSVTIDGRTAEVLQENDKGDLWVRWEDGAESMVPSAVVGAWRGKQDDMTTDHPSDEGGAARFVGRPLGPRGDRFAELASVLSKVARGEGVQVRLESRGARDAMGDYRKGPKAPKGMVTVDKTLPAEVIAQVISHEIGHAVIESSSTFDRNGKWRKPTFKTLFEDLGYDGDTLKEQAKTLSRVLLGGKLSAYNATTEELLARTIEAAIFAPELLAEHAPDLDAALTALSGSNPLLSSAISGAEAGILDSPTKMFLPDRRQAYVKHLGRYLGTKAWGNEMAYRSRRIQAVEYAGRLIKEKMKGVKDDPSLLFKAAEGILSNSDTGLVFGTKKYQTLDPGRNAYNSEAEAAHAAGYRYGATKQDGTEVWVAWRVTPGEARRAFEELSREGKHVVLEFTSDAAEASDVFSREKLKAYAGIEANIQGWVHHFYPEGHGPKGGTARLKRMTAATRRKRAEKGGYSTDFWAASLKSISEVLVERVQNEFVTHQMALVMEPLESGEKARTGYTEVSGDLVKGFFADGEKTYMVPVYKGGFMPVKPGRRYQVPTELWEAHLKRRSVAIESSQVSKMFDSMSKYWTVNMLTHPGTWATNMSSGALQFGAKLMTDFYEGILTGDMRHAMADIVGVFETMTPRGWNRAADHVFGGRVGNFYQQFVDMDGTGIGKVDRVADKALYGMQQVERFWKKAILNAESRAHGFPSMSDKDFLAHVNDVVDLYAYDYSNIPLWLHAWRTSPAGRTVKPFFVYPYKYAKMLMSHAGAAFDVNLPWQTRLAKVMSLATMVSAWMLFRHWRDDESETAKTVYGLPDGVDADKLKSVVDARGRIYVGKDDEGREILLRTAKYPVMNVADIAYASAHGDFNSAGDIIKDQVGSIGWLGEGVLAMLGYSGDYTRYQDLPTRMTGIGAGFIPGSRVLKDVSDAMDPKVREYPMTPGKVLAQYVPLTNEQVMEDWRGAERVYKVPLPNGLKLGTRTTVDMAVVKHREDPLLRLLGGVVVKRVDPDWQKRFIDRAKLNLGKKTAKLSER